MSQQEDIEGGEAFKVNIHSKKLMEKERKASNSFPSSNSNSSNKTVRLSGRRYMARRAPAKSGGKVILRCGTVGSRRGGEGAMASRLFLLVETGKVSSMTSSMTKR